MPCNSDYLDADPEEIRNSRLLCLLEEIETGKPVDPHSKEWRGYHAKVYNKSVSKEVVDAWVAKLCDALSYTEVSKYSLEMQIFWRDHQRADREREKSEVKAKAMAKIRKKALDKLTTKEREALGLTVDRR